MNNSLIHIPFDIRFPKTLYEEGEEEYKEYELTDELKEYLEERKYDQFVIIFSEDSYYDELFLNENLYTLELLLENLEGLRDYLKDNLNEKSIEYILEYIQHRKEDCELNEGEREDTLISQVIGLLDRFERFIENLVDKKR